jgi:hypothetical protein
MYKAMAAAAVVASMSPAQQQPHHHAAHHKPHPVVRQAAVKTPPPSVERLRHDLEDMRQELEDVRARVYQGGNIGWEGTLIQLGPRSKADDGMKLASLADLRLPEQEPAIPVPPEIFIPPLAIDEQYRVREAVDYLVRTATPGYTMVRQGVRISVERLHPAFAVRLADAIRRAREEGLTNAGLFSAYRPPIFGVGGFSDKFNSLHSYGLAADIAGIGRPGSHEAYIWKHVVDRSGLYLPYGPDNHVEWNHTQLIPARIASRSIRSTITSAGPKDVRRMWQQSGVKSFLPTLDTPIQSEAANGRPKLLH